VPVIVTTVLLPPATATSAPFQTATPGLAPLGTLSYPLTVTAELALDATRVQDYRARLFATRTAAAGQAVDAHAALTATAQKGR